MCSVPRCDRPADKLDNDDGLQPCFQLGSKSDPAIPPHAQLDEPSQRALEAKIEALNRQLEEQHTEHSQMVAKLEDRLAAFVVSSRQLPAPAPAPSDDGAAGLLPSVSAAEAMAEAAIKEMVAGAAAVEAAVGVLLRPQCRPACSRRVAG